MDARCVCAPSEFDGWATWKFGSRNMSTTRAVWLFVAVLTAIRFSLLATTDLSFDEAHYWMWSERLAPAYFSKGPGIAFAIRASTAVFGATEFGVRFFSPVLAAATSLLLFYFASRLFGATAGLWAVIGLNATPIFNIGAVLMTIDAPSIFFCMPPLFTFSLSMENPERFRGSWYWPGTGLLIGLGLDRKSTRLNCSHQIISYAVFCLKKKRNTCGLPSRDHPLPGTLPEKQHAR